MVSPYLDNISNKTKVISFCLTTGESVSALAVKQEEDGSIFVLADPLDKVMQMHYDDEEDVDYANTALRSWLNLTLVKQFPEEIVKKMLPFENGDFIRLPTEREIFGENLWGEHGDENIQQWGCMENDLIRGCNNWYWLQTKTITSSPKEYCCVTNSGSSNFLSPYLLSGVRPVFKLIYESEESEPSLTKIETPTQKETDGENVPDLSKNGN